MTEKRISGIQELVDCVLKKYLMKAHKHGYDEGYKKGYREGRIDVEEGR